jgi:hypothetical protein
MWRLFEIRGETATSSANTNTAALNGQPMQYHHVYIHPYIRSGAFFQCFPLFLTCPERCCGMQPLSAIILYRIDTNLGH